MNEGSDSKQNQAKANGGAKNEEISAKNTKSKDIQDKRDLKAKTGGEEKNQAKAKSSIKKEDIGAKQKQAKAKGSDKKEGISDTGIKDC